MTKFKFKFTRSDIIFTQSRSTKKQYLCCTFQQQKQLPTRVKKCSHFTCFSSLLPESTKKSVVFATLTFSHIALRNESFWHFHFYREARGRFMGNCFDLSESLLRKNKPRERNITLLIAIKFFMLVLRVWNSPWQSRNLPCKKPLSKLPSLGNHLLLHSSSCRTLILVAYKICKCWECRRGL